MGLSFRKSLRWGPLRVNFSGGGIGLSAGLRGARISVGPRGTYVSLSSHGFTYRQKLGDTRAARPAREIALPEEVPGSLGASIAEGFIPSASMDTLQTQSPDAVLRDLEERLNRTNVFAVCLCAALAAWLLFGSQAGWNSPLLWILGGLLVAGSVPVYRWDRDQRTAVLFYDVDDAQCMDRFAAACACGQALGSSSALWHVYWQAPTADWKRNAGASHLMRRTRVRSSPGTIPGVLSNLEPWSVAAGPQKLMFLPDRLLVREGRRGAGVPYEALRASASPTRFIESENVPADARVVGRTWRYVNKSGGPDRRFNNNRELPIMEYGEITLESDTGMRVLFHTSTAEAATRTAKALAVLGSLARRAARNPDEPSQDGTAFAGRAPPPTAGPRMDPSLPLASAQKAAHPPENDQVREAFLILLKSIAVADRKFSDVERTAIVDAMMRIFPGDGAMRSALARQLEELRVAPACVAEALALVEKLPIAQRAAVLAAGWTVANADGRVTPKERERLAEFTQRLGPFDRRTG